MLIKRTLIVVLFCSVVFSISPLLYGQANGSFLGTVSDKTGSVISGATVTVTSQGTGLSRETKTDDTGHYLTPLLPVGNYTIRVNSQGFKTVEQTDIRLQVNEQREVDFTLVPGSVKEAVEVSATEVAVETSTPTLGQVITAEQVADLPLNGRNFVQLATLTPGTTQETNPNSFFNAGPSSEVSARGTYSLSVGGSRAQSTDWLLDGNDNNELTAGGISIIPSIDAIQEFKVLTYNYSAEYGTRAGPTVLVTTKSGSNTLHGSLFEFFRNTKLDARSFFASTKEQFNLNQFGGAIGGPIQKDKTFFFADYQAKRQRHGTPFVGAIPTPAMKNGDFSLDPFGVPRPNTFDFPATKNKDGFTDLVNLYDFTAFQCDPVTGDPLDAGAGGVQPTGVACNKIPVNMFDMTGKRMIDLYPTSNASNASSPLASSSGKLRVFAGLRDDPFFFNFAGFNAAVTTVKAVKNSLTFDAHGCPALSAGQVSTLGRQLSTNPATDGGAAVNGLAGANVLALAIEIDTSLLTAGGPIVGVWASTNRAQ